MLCIDGSMGEGGGQILRTSLALSLVTGTAFRVDKLRARRQRPGLMRQHLTAVRAAAEVSAAEVRGAEVGSLELEFRPQKITPGAYHFSVGSAGSTMLVLQTVLPALVLGSRSSTLVLEGGTHNPLAPPFDFLERAFLPLLCRMGPRVAATLVRPGFYPAGGGRVEVEVMPAGSLSRLDLCERGAVRSVRATALLSALPFAIARRELDVVERRLGWPADACRPLMVEEPVGPGNVLTLEVESEHLAEVFTGFGEKGMRAEEVAERVVAEVEVYLQAGVPVGLHLCDQLLLLLALAGGGSFVTLPLTLHSETQIEVLGRFLGTRVQREPVGPNAWHVEVAP
jgi:RNA 3'-terminal phosphate cyclase (ATP)